MAKFIYKMQSLLNIKEKLEDQAKTAYGLARMTLNGEEAKLAQLIARKEQYVEQKRQETTTENRKSFEGLPVTYAAVIFPLLSILRLWVDAKPFAWIYGIVLMVTAFFNLARIRVPKPQI